MWITKKYIHIVLTIKFYLSKRSVMVDLTAEACPVVCPSTSWSHVEWMINQSVLTTTHHTRPIANWSCIAFNPNRGLDICGTTPFVGVDSLVKTRFVSFASQLQDWPITLLNPLPHSPPPHSPHPHLPHTPTSVHHPMFPKQ